MPLRCAGFEPLRAVKQAQGGYFTQCFGGNENKTQRDFRHYPRGASAGGYERAIVSAFTNNKPCRGPPMLGRRRSFTRRLPHFRRRGSFGNLLAVTVAGSCHCGTSSSFIALINPLNKLLIITSL